MVHLILGCADVDEDNGDVPQHLISNQCTASCRKLLLSLQSSTPQLMMTMMKSARPQSAWIVYVTKTTLVSAAVLLMSSLSVLAFPTRCPIGEC